MPYQLETIQGMGMQVELLYQHGFPAAWGWSSKALKRMGDIVSRSDAAGGTGWNETSMSRQMPWLLNRRYGTNYPTRVNGTGRLIGFTSWLYGSGTNAAPPSSVSADRGGHHVSDRPSPRTCRRAASRPSCRGSSRPRAAG